MKKTNHITTIAKGAVLGLLAITGAPLAEAQNVASGNAAFIGGGLKNTASGNLSSILGGFSNTASGANANILGGNGNTATGGQSGIITGSNNTVTGSAGQAAIISGNNNSASGLSSGIFVGNTNSASGSSAVILTGRTNVNSGNLSVLLSGDSSTLGASDSLLFGSDIRVPGGDGIVYLADDSRGGTQLNQNIPDDTFVGRFDGGFQFFTSPTSSTSGQVTINPDGRFIVGTGTPTNRTFFDVTGRGDNNTIPNGHVAVIRGTAAGNSSQLAIVSGDSTPSSADNYITFFDASNTARGAIEGNGASGVTFRTSGADFAEYLPKEDSDAQIKSGEIVGLREGKIAHLGEAESFMVVSRAPAFLGNSPGEDETSSHEKIAFVGQVPVKVHGEVESGDFILASEKGDGTGIALASSEIPVNAMHRVVGRAMESNSSQELKEVNTVVGLDQTSLLIPALQRLEEKNRQLEAQNKALLKTLTGRLARLEQSLDDTSDRNALVPVSAGLSQ